MEFKEFLEDKSVKPKLKTEAMGKWIVNGYKKVSELIEFAQTAKDPIKATCIEALEYATKMNPAIATPECLDFVTAALLEKAPRVKWEAAKVVGNIAHLYPNDLDVAIGNLLENTKHTGTVVRWSAAFALGKIIMMKTPLNAELVPRLEAICEQEEKPSIKKIYLDALKKSV